MYLKPQVKQSQLPTLILSCISNVLQCGKQTFPIEESIVRIELCTYKCSSLNWDSRLTATFNGQAKIQYLLDLSLLPILSLGQLSFHNLIDMTIKRYEIKSFKAIPIATKYLHWKTRPTLDTDSCVELQVDCTSNNLDAK